MARRGEQRRAGRRFDDVAGVHDHDAVAVLGGERETVGMIRVACGGDAIALEVWSLPQEKVGAFLRNIAAPLGLGTRRPGRRLHA